MTRSMTNELVEAIGIEPSLLESQVNQGICLCERATYRRISEGIEWRSQAQTFRSNGPGRVVSSEYPNSRWGLLVVTPSPRSCSRVTTPCWRRAMALSRCTPTFAVCADVSGMAPLWPYSRCDDVSHPQAMYFG